MRRRESDAHGERGGASYAVTLSPTRRGRYRPGTTSIPDSRNSAFESFQSPTNSPFQQYVQVSGTTATDDRGNVVRTRIYVTDILQWEDGPPRPWLQVAKLIDPDVLVEIEADDVGDH
jgi:hypothetical protein